MNFVVVECVVDEDCYYDECCSQVLSLTNDFFQSCEPQQTNCL